MNPVEQVFPPPENLSGHTDSPPPEREQLAALLRENADLRRTNKRIAVQTLLDARDWCRHQAETIHAPIAYRLVAIELDRRARELENKK